VSDAKPTLFAVVFVDVMGIVKPQLLGFIYGVFALLQRTASYTREFVF